MALTDTRLRNLRGTGTRFELPDRDGLSLRVSQRGRMTWTVSFRVRGAGDTQGTKVRTLAGAKARLSLGEYPEVSLAEARGKAQRVKRLAHSGKGPSASDVFNRTTVLTVKSLFERFKIEQLDRNHRVGKNIALLMHRHVLPALGERELISVQRSDLISLLEIVRVSQKVTIRDGRDRSLEIYRGGPGAAAEVRKWTRAMFQFGVDNGMLPANPFAGLRNRDKQVARDHVLTIDELRMVWGAASSIPYPWGPFFQLLILTGSRRGEWANAQTTWLNSQFSRLEIPSTNYKTGKAQVVPLSRQAAAIAMSLPKQQFGQYILSSTGGSRPISGFSKAKVALDEHIRQQADAGVRPWVVHDLRRSMATHMERIGVEPHIIEVCLGHALKGVAGVYRHYAYLPEKTVALQKWADEILTQ